MPQNIKFEELLGKNFNGANYMVSSNWRINFANSGLKDLIQGASNVDTVLMQMSYACHSSFSFETSLTYAEAEIKGIHISQAAWQDRYIDDFTVEVYENMDHRVFNALLVAANSTAGFLEHRNINKKDVYTFNGITLEALGNGDGSSGEVESVRTYNLLGVQVLSVQSPEYTSDSANIGTVTLHLRAHGWE